jgi:uncharacterized membrane protein YkoI
MKKQLVLLTAMSALLVGCFTSEEVVDPKVNADTTPDAGTQFEDLPAAVQRTVRAEAPGVKIDDIDKETRTGRVIYEITFAQPGENPKLHVAEDGTIVKFGETVVETAGAATDSIGTEFGELPHAVQRTIQMRAPGVRIDDIDREMRTGRTIYEITFEEPGKNPKLHVAEDGSIVQDLK